MPLLPCKDCEEPIFDDADECPHCGCHNPHVTDADIKIFLLIIGFGFFLAITAALAF